MKLEDRLAAWNERAAANLDRCGSALPAVVLQHALRSRWIPRTARAAVDMYWRAHPLRAEGLARGLADRSGTPAGWSWTINAADGSAASFRAPPLAHRLRNAKPRPGACAVCGQPVYRFGWHCDLWGAGAPNQRAAWHSCCVVAWKFWNAPSDHRRLLSKLQGRRCALSGRRLLRTAEVDHREPLFQVWRDRRDAPWPELLGFWGRPNLQVVNLALHAEKSVAETRERAQLRLAGLRVAGEPVPDLAAPDQAGR